MTLREIRDTVYSRNKQKREEIYALSSMIRVAVLSCFSKEVRFPDPPNEEKEKDWKNSYNYLKALQQIHKGGANE